MLFRVVAKSFGSSGCRKKPHERTLLLIRQRELVKQTAPDNNAFSEMFGDSDFEYLRDFFGKGKKK